MRNGAAFKAGCTALPLAAAPMCGVLAMGGFMTSGEAGGPFLVFVSVAYVLCWLVELLAAHMYRSLRMLVLYVAFWGAGIADIAVTRIAGSSFSGGVWSFVHVIFMLPMAGFSGASPSVWLTLAPQLAMLAAGAAALVFFLRAVRGGAADGARSEADADGEE